MQLSMGTDFKSVPILSVKDDHAEGAIQTWAGQDQASLAMGFLQALEMGGDDGNAALGRRGPRLQ